MDVSPPSWGGKPLSWRAAVRRWSCRVSRSVWSQPGLSWRAGQKWKPFSQNSLLVFKRAHVATLESHFPSWTPKERVCTKDAEFINPFQEPCLARCWQPAVWLSQNSRWTEARQSPRWEASLVWVLNASCDITKGKLFAHSGPSTTKWWKGWSTCSFTW